MNLLGHFAAPKFTNRTTGNARSEVLPEEEGMGCLHGIRILAISGSLRTLSSNTAALEAAAYLAPTGVEVCLYHGLATLPHFNPDDDQLPLPDPVADLRRQVSMSDALLIASPEYAHGIAGVLKNALDWLVGSLDFAGKPVAILNTSPRAFHADAQLREVLATMAGQLVRAASFRVPIAGRQLDVAAVVSDPQLSQQLRAALMALTPTRDRHGTGNKSSQSRPRNMEGAGA